MGRQHAFPIERCENAPDKPDAARVFPRPPGALPEVLFADRCTGCLDCVAVCPTRILNVDEEGLPVLLAPHRCANCGLCADICSPAALRFTEKTEAGIERLLAAERLQYVQELKNLQLFQQE